MAGECEDMARAIEDKASRQIARDIAAYWRALTDAARAVESRRHALPQST
jgi:hypothetical protein